MIIREMFENALERFVEYVQVDTRSKETKPGEEERHPSSEGQLVLGHQIKDDLREICEEPKITEFKDGSFILHIPATEEKYEKKPHVVFAAHLDTYYNVDGKAHPKNHKYTGGDLVVNEDLGIVIPASDLAGLEGQNIITSDGTTLLGADDKAGVAVMVSMIEYLKTNNVPHGPLSFWFCVDEEIGQLDISVIPREIVESWTILWTLDGERLNAIDIGCFIGRKMVITFMGMDAHPGVSGDKLMPAHYAAAHLTSYFATHKYNPTKTSGMEPIIYVTGIEGNASNSRVTCMPRSFSNKESDKLANAVVVAADRAARMFGVKVNVTDRVSNANTRSAIDPKMDLVQPAIDAIMKRGYKKEEVELKDIRGGTDGGMLNLTYPHLPAPNLGCGGKNLHGPQEFLVVKDLHDLCGVVINMIDDYRDNFPDNF